MTRDEFISAIEKIRSEYPDNIMAASIDLDATVALTDQEFQHVFAIVRTGIENPDSHVGAYAISPDDYDTYRWLLGPIMDTYHKLSSDFVQQNDWNLTGEFDLRSIDSTLKDVSMRVRVARNVTEFPLPGSMTRQDRVDFENRMVSDVISGLTSRFGGNYYSLTKGSDYHIDDSTYNDLVDQHLMFKDMGNDPYLASAGISGDWPDGRGMWVSDDKNMIIWINEEDHLRIISMARGTDLSLVFNNLKELLSAVEKSGMTFAVSDKYGTVTSCPSNMGTGMRASVHIALPNLVKDEKKMKAIAKSHGLSARGTGGEHTAYGEGGVVDISPSARLGVKESDIVRMLFEGIKAMLTEEKKA